MIKFNIFNYSITIRKIKERKPHHMNTQAYSRDIEARRKATTQALRVKYDKHLKSC